MTIRGMVRHDVNENSDVVSVKLFDHLIEFVERADPRVNLHVVVNVVAAIGKGRWVEGAKPNSVYSEGCEVVDPRDDALEISNAVTIVVSEASRVNLVNHSIPPPVSIARKLIFAHLNEPLSLAVQRLANERFALFDSRSIWALAEAKLLVVAPIAQGIERRSPEAGAQVRILLGALTVLTDIQPSVEAPLHGAKCSTSPLVQAPQPSLQTPEG